MRASRVVTAAIVRSLGAVDESISVTQLRTLVLVDGQGPLTVTAVAEALGVNASNASRTCDRLVTAGLLDRRAAEDDRRRVALTLTEAGRATVEAVMERRRTELAVVVEQMAPRDRAGLARALERFAHAAEAVPDGSGGSGGEEHLIAWLS
ncbi:MAG: MarR family winged helix-turn-helix transcriptional regulator [Marmoricola sp.]